MLLVTQTPVASISLPAPSIPIHPEPCGACSEPATVSITFAYDAKVERVVHPLFHTYPVPRFYSCPAHLGPLMGTDPESRSWLVKFL